MRAQAAFWNNWNRLEQHFRNSPMRSLMEKLPESLFLLFQLFQKEEASHELQAQRQ